jgi:C4-dicarboxylate-specific signal transduction histidine kinase
MSKRSASQIDNQQEQEELAVSSTNSESLNPPKRTRCANKKSKNSWVWEHFSVTATDTEYEYGGKKRAEMFITCSYCTWLTLESKRKGSTGNLIKHLKDQHKIDKDTPVNLSPTTTTTITTNKQQIIEQLQKKNEQLRQDTEERLNKLNEQMQNAHQDFEKRKQNFYVIIRKLEEERDRLKWDNIEQKSLIKQLETRVEQQNKELETLYAEPLPKKVKEQEEEIKTLRSMNYQLKILNSLKR